MKKLSLRSTPRLVRPVRGESLTVQSAKDECDINVLVRRVLRGDEIPENDHSPQYLDVSESSDYLQGQVKLAEYSNYFSTLSSQVRKFFDNDYRNMLSADVTVLAKFGIMGVEFPNQLDLPFGEAGSNSLLDKELLGDTKKADKASA